MQTSHTAKRKTKPMIRYFTHPHLSKIRYQEGFKKLHIPKCLGQP
jgi:hypothetical protein